MFILEILYCNDQILTLSVTKGNLVDWVISTVYASLKKRYRDELLSFLQALGDHISILWLLVGNFNQMLSHDEKRGAL